MVVTNLTNLTRGELIAKGGDVKAKLQTSTLPGIAEDVTAFAALHTAAEAAQQAYESAKIDCKAKLAALNAALKEYKAGFKVLATRIELVTEGDPEAVLSVGLDLKAARSPTLELEAPTNVRVATNGTPGVSKLTIEPLAGAVSYLVQMSPDPISEDSWEQVATPTKSTCKVEGAEPGKKCWFRVAGVNALGQGPWSDPVARPVV